MELLSKVSYKRLYWGWGVLFAFTGVLGLLFPGAENSLGLFCLRAVSVMFFLPPWMILAKGKTEGKRFHIRLVRYLALASLTATLVLFCAGILAVPHSQALGDGIHVAMSILCAPMVCSNYYILPMFLWATLLVGSFQKGKLKTERGY